MDDPDEEGPESKPRRLIGGKMHRSLGTLDVTGGAPELNEHFRRLVSAARAQGLRVIDRCNLTILSEPGQEDLAAFLAAEGVEVVASLPCYSVANVDRQRGDGPPLMDAGKLVPDEIVIGLVRERGLAMAEAAP